MVIINSFCVPWPSDMIDVRSYGTCDDDPWADILNCGVDGFAVGLLVGTDGTAVGILVGADGVVIRFVLGTLDGARDRPNAEQ